MKNALTIIISILLAGALAFCVGWAIKNKDKIIEIANGANLYTEKDVEDAYNKGKNDATTSLIAYEQEINTLKNRIEELNSQKNELEINKNAEIEELTSQIATLQQSLNECLNMLETLQNDSFSIVTFDTDGNLSMQIVLKNEFAVLPTTPYKEGYTFVGWTLNNEIVNVEEYVITENVTFVAKFEKLFSVIFMSDNTVVSNENLTEGSEINFPEDQTKDYYTFKGWSENGIDLIDSSEVITATKDVIYYAVFENESYVIYTYANGSKFYREHTNIRYDNIIDECSDMNFITEIKLPTSVKIIENGAFSLFENLQKITLSKNVEEIESNAISNSEIKEIVILNANVKINRLFIYSIKNNINIEFAGTKEQWASNCPNSYSEILYKDADSTGIITVNCSNGILTFTK